MAMCFHCSFRVLRLTAALSVALAAFAAVADSDSTCPDEVECCRSRTVDDRSSQGAPAQGCAGRPCRTPLRLANPDQTPLALGGAVSTLRPEPARPLFSAEPTAPPTPPPIPRPAFQ
jgi:hypothetical protein